MLLMEKMHNLSKTWVVKAILMALPISFLVSGMYGYLGSSADNSVVKVNGEEISQDQFQHNYNEKLQTLSQQLGVTKFAVLVDKPEFTNEVRSTVLNDLIDQELLRQYVKSLDLSVSDEAIKRAIVSQPELQVDGKFSNEAYKQMLRNNNMNADMYAQYLREALRLSQLQQGFVTTEFVTSAQQELLIKGLLQQRTVRLAVFPLANEVANQSVTDQEIQDYYNSHKDTFKMPEMVKVQYVDLNKEALEKSINVTDVEIQQYYQDHKSDFETKAQQRLAHIQFATEQEAKDAYSALQAGADFAQLAKEKSADKFSAQNGGDLGWLNTGDLPKNFEDAAAALEIGNYSAPVNIDGNYHIIKLEERKLSSQLSVDQVRDQIVELVRQDLLANQFYTIEKQVAEKAAESSDSLDAAAAVAGLKVQETGYFSRQDLPEALNFPVLSNAMFDGEISQGNMNSEPMSVGENHSIVVRVLDHKMEGMQSLENAKSTISNLLARQKAEKVITENANKLVAKLQQGQNPESVKFGSAEKWVYLENKDPALTSVIFSMAHPENGKSTFAVTKNNAGDVVIAALDSVEDGQATAQSQTALNSQALLAQAQVVQADLLKSLREKAKIDFNEDYLKQYQD